MLIRDRGKLLTHRALLREVWGVAYQDDTQTLRSPHRQPAPQDRARAGTPRLIRTDPGIGYRLIADD